MARGSNARGRPVADLDIRFEWHGGDWERLFDAQIELVKNDVARAKAEDRLVVYLSCPISARGGGYSGTNVDVAQAIQRRLLERWGEGVWILNPAQYQMESRAGTGLMNMHASRLGIDIEALVRDHGPPGGGDYMRMWTKVLAENGEQVGRHAVDPRLADTGQYFDAYYFIGPTDVQKMFLGEGETLTAGISEYFARKTAVDPDFCDYYSVSGIAWEPLVPGAVMDAGQARLRNEWQRRRNDFLRFYLFRAGANYSLGCHDEWNIFLGLNARRRAILEKADGRELGGIGEQIAGFFDGRQIDPASTEIGVSGGYAI